MASPALVLCQNPHDSEARQSVEKMMPDGAWELKERERKERYPSPSSCEPSVQQAPSVPAAPKSSNRPWTPSGGRVVLPHRPVGLTAMLLPGESCPGQITAWAVLSPAEPLWPWAFQKSFCHPTAIMHRLWHTSSKSPKACLIESPSHLSGMPCSHEHTPDTWGHPAVAGPFRSGTMACLYVSRRQQMSNK